VKSEDSQQRVQKFFTTYKGDGVIGKMIDASPPELQNFIVTLYEKVGKLFKIGAALSAERDLPRLLQMIVEEACICTNADGVTLYLMSSDQKKLNFEIVQNTSLNIKMGGASGNPITWQPVPLYLNDNTRNRAMVSAHVALTGGVVNIDDVYNVRGFDFSGTRTFDANTGYRSKSMLVLPLRNHDNDIIGVLQLINCISPVTHEVVSFSEEDQELAVSLASQAAVAITNARLIRDLEQLFESFIQVIASAIDEKSHYTAGHIARVAELTMLLANVVNRIDYGKYAKVQFDQNQLKELRIAAWMHDVGKITIPEHIVDKSTKLQTIFDRINHIQLKFELLKQTLKLDLLSWKLDQLECHGDKQRLNVKEQEYYSTLRQLDSDLEFVKTCNSGKQCLSEEDRQRLLQIAAKKIRLDNLEMMLLSGNEIENLAITQGTLTDRERDIINNHAAVTLKMLRQLSYPHKIEKIPEIAGAHHEKPDGSGYPQGLSGEQLGLQSKILALADVFEALTARDRPYKKATSLSESIQIMQNMAEHNHIDSDLFKIFVQERVYLDYAYKFIDPAQIDTEIFQL
jgi:HD-GYP domain-containing protein (c-di-GMP phosphodiesterase class II)